MDKKLRILHLEDSPADAQLIGFVLKKGGLNFEQLVVDTRDAFINALKNFAPDIILSDHSLPSFNSHEALDLFQQTGMSIPFILVTGNTTEEFAVDVIKRGAEDYILKDRPERLPTAIRNSLEKCRLAKERQAFLDELIKNEKRYRALVENGADAIFILNPEGKPRYVSPSITRILGYAEQEAMHLDLFKITHPDDRIVANQRITECLENAGITVDGHLRRIRHKNGSWVWLESTLTNMLHDPAINGIIDNFHDVSERKIGEEKLLTANRLYSFISEINQAIVRVNDEEAIYKEACRIALEFGNFKAAWIGMFNLAEQKINLVESRGIPPRDLAKFKNVSYSETGLQFRVLESGSYYTCNDIMQAEGLSPLKKYASARGIESCIVLPIHKFGTIIGTFNFYAGVVNFFNEEEINLLQEATDDISFAIGVFEKDKQRKHAEQQLQLSESRLKQAQAIAHLGSWSLNFATGIAMWSEEHCRIYGLSCENHTPSYETWLSFIHPHDRQSVVELTQQGRKTGKSFTFQHRIVRTDGTVRHINCQNHFEYDKEGKPLGLYGVSHDITEIKEAEDALRKSEYLYRQIVETGQEGIWLIDEDNLTTFVNKKMCEILGYSEQEMIGKSNYSFKDEKGKQAALKDIERRKTGVYENHDSEFLTKSGRLIAVNVSTNPIFDDNGVYRGALAMVSDITEKKALETLLDKANTLSRIGSWEVDPIAGTVYWSRITREIHEVDAAFVPDITTAINFYKPRQSRANMTSCVNKALQEGLAWDIELEIITARGNERWVRAIGEAELVNGKCVKLYGSFQDIDATKRAEQAVLKAYEESLINIREREKMVADMVQRNKDLEQFSYIVSHNLRAPVANIIGLTDGLTDHTQAAEVKELFLNGLILNVKLLDAVISDLNHILQVKREISENKEPVNLELLVEAIQSSIHNLIRKEQVQIVTDFTAVGEFNTIRSYLHSIFYNLISNSIKYRRADLQPLIGIISEKTGDKLVITFSDNGTGFNLKKNGGQVFGLYKRFHHHIEGKGMGLFMVKTQVEILGGKITVTSEPDQGATFRIEFED